MRLAPHYFFWKYTDLCNSRCTTCRLWATDGETLDVSLVDRLPRFLSRRRLREIYFTGGEPLLPDNSADMAIALTRWCPGVVISGATNGLDAERYLDAVRCMIAGGVTIRLQVSLNGTAATHNKTRGLQHAYESAIKTAEGLAKLGVLRSFNQLLHPGITTDKDRQHVREMAQRLRVGHSYSHLMRNMPWFGVPDDGATIPRFICHAMNVICFHPNGDITACQEPRPELRLGNLSDDCFDDEKLKQAIRIVKSGECQPCGCCTGAYTHGIRCTTGVG